MISMPRFVTLSAMLIGAASFGCCVNWQVIPDSSGKVTEGGRPVVGASVFVSDLITHESKMQGCERPIAEAVTDTDGRFALSEVRRRRRWIPLPGDPGNSWRVCVLVDGELIASWDHHELVREREYLEMTCEILDEGRCELDE